MGMMLLLSLLLFLAGFVDSIAGGGGLISLPAYLIVGLPPHQAIASNKFSAAIGTTASAFRFFRKGYMSRECLLYIVLAMLGAQVGSRLAVHIPERLFQGIMLIVLPLVALFSFLSQHRREKLEQRQKESRQETLEGAALTTQQSHDAANSPMTSLKSLDPAALESLAQAKMKSPASTIHDSSVAATRNSPIAAKISRRQLLIASAGSLLIGCYDGLYGPGTGTFLLLLLSELAGYNISHAAGTTKAVNLASNIGSLLFFFSTDLIRYAYALPGAAFCMLGHTVGSALVVKKGRKIVQAIIFIVLLLLFIKVISDMLQ